MYFSHLPYQTSRFISTDCFPMTKKYAVLQKKLEELESEMNDVFKLPTDTEDHQLVSESVDRRIGFLRSLLSAELESHPSRPHHLHHIDQRLTALETKFQDWDNFPTFSPLVHINAASSCSSSCSCTKSCLNDDDSEANEMGDIGELTFYENPESVSEDEKKAEKVQVEDPEFIPEGEKKEEVETQTGSENEKIDKLVKKVQVEEHAKEAQSKHGNRKFRELMKRMLVLGVLGVLIALAYRACCCCVKERMEVEGFLRPT